MAFTEEQEAQILENMAKFGEFLAKQNEQNNQDKGEDLKEQAKKGMKEEEEAQQVQARLEKALAFNMKIGKFAEDYKGVLPESAKSIVDLAEKKTYTSAVERANDIRRALIDAYLEKQDNIDSLPETLRNKVVAYKALAEDAKIKKSSEFWDIVEVGAEMQTSKIRAAALNKANGKQTGEESAFRGRFFSLGDKYKRKD